MNNAEVIDVGFVLNGRDYKEKDKIITIYFKNYGKLGLIAKGIRNIKSKNASACLPNHLIEFKFIPRSGLSTLIKATNIKNYSYLENDFNSQVYASYFLEFLYRYEEENRPNLKHYEFLEKLHDYLNVGYSPYLLYGLMNAYLLKSIGSRVFVDRCSCCNNTNNIVGISIVSGGFVCNDCIVANDLRCEKEVLKCFRFMNKADFTHLDRAKFSKGVLDMTNGIMDTFVDEYSGIQFNSRKFM